VAKNGGRLGALLIANLRASPAKSAVLGIGCVVLVVLLARLVVSGPKQAEADTAIALIPETTAAPKAAAEDGDVVKLVARPRLPRPTVRQTLARDPFASDWLAGLAGPMSRVEVEENAETDEALSLQLIMTSDRLDGTRMAIISGLMVYPGSQIGGYEVSEIARYHVTLRNRTGEILLRLP